MYEVVYEPYHPYWRPHFRNRAFKEPLIFLSDRQRSRASCPFHHPYPKGINESLIYTILGDEFAELGGGVFSLTSCYSTGVQFKTNDHLELSPTKRRYCSNWLSLGSVL